MALPNIFTNAVTADIIQRIDQLKPDSTPKWGKMSVSQMLAHCNVVYELVYEDKHPKPNFLTRFMLKTFAKKIVTSEKPYKQNSPTAPAFLVKDDKDFEKEKQRLIGFINKTAALGEAHFDNKVYISFGVMNKQEWNNMFYKHLDHHLTQFGV